MYDIDHGLKSDDETLILLKTGQVIKVSRDDQKLLPAPFSSTDENWYKFTIDNNRYLLSWERIEASEDNTEKDFFLSSRASYVPTTVASMAVAQSYHREARRGWTEDAQCFNKGMVWKYEWWRKHSLKSMSLFIFFTRTYIRKYNFEWWFHIAPYFHVMHEGKVVERVMDIKYTRNPLPFKKWSDIFMRNDATCKIITKYSDYADYPYTGNCYFMRTNMYMYQPADLEMEEAWGDSKDAFLMNEVKGAYEQCFKMSI